MSRANLPTDVFRYIDMAGGDTTKCWNWTNDAALSGRDARPYFNLKGKRVLAYRIVFSLTFGRPLEDMKSLRHTCDNQRCCNPHHLIEGTHQENMDDMKMRERHGLTHHAIKAIKRLLKRGVLTHEMIAELFGISRTLVTSIANDACYSHVEVTQEEMIENREHDKQCAATALKLKPPRGRIRPDGVESVSDSDVRTDGDGEPSEKC